MFTALSWLTLALAATDLGGWLSTEDGFKGPRAVAAMPGGGMLVADSDGSAVYRIDSDGSRSLVAGPDMLLHPGGVAAADDNTIVIADTGHDRILIIDVDGYIVSVVSGGKSPHEAFDSPTDVDTDGSVIAVADSGNHRIHILAMDGSLKAIIGKRGTGPGEFRRPQGLAIDRKNGHIVVSDTGNHRIQSIAMDGTPQWQAGQWGSFAGFFCEPGGIDVDQDMIVVADRLNHRVQILNASDGSFQGYWGMHAVTPRQGEGRIHYPDDVALLPGGLQAIVVEGFEDRLQVFGERTSEDAATGDLTRRLGVQSHFGDLIALDGRALFLWEPASRAVLVFDISQETPIHVSTFGRPGDQGDAFDDPVSMTYDASTMQLRVLDAGSMQAKDFAVTLPPQDAPRFDPGAVRLIGTTPLEGPLDTDQIAGDRLSVTDSDGSVFVVDPADDVIRHFDRDGHLIDTIGSKGTDHGELWEPRAIVMDEQGRLIVVDHGNHRMQMFDRDGRWLMTFGIGRAWTPQTLPRTGGSS